MSALKQFITGPAAMRKCTITRHMGACSVELCLELLSASQQSMTHLSLGLRRAWMEMIPKNMKILWKRHDQEYGTTMKFVACKDNMEIIWINFKNKVI